MKKYELPELPYDYNALEPHISGEQLRIHHEKHHKAYVDGANKLLDTLDEARKNDKDLDMKATLKELSWQVGGHKLHALYWYNMSPEGGGEPLGELQRAINSEFGSFERFKREFQQTAKSVEGSGWVALAYCHTTGRLLLMQIEKHNTNVYPGHRILLVMDMFEHAYYIDHQNEKAKYIEAFFNVINWDQVQKRYKGE